jgi:general secretion pathway protein C
MGETGVPIPRVRRGSLLALLGLETGDQLLRVNSLDVRSPEQALQAYAMLRRSDRLVLEVRRGDRVIELVYHIV